MKNSLLGMPTPIVIGNAVALQPNELISAFVERVYRGATVTSIEAISSLRERVVRRSVGIVVGLGRILPAFGDLCPDPVSVSLGHTHLRLITPFLSTAEAKLLTEHVLNGPAGMGEPHRIHGYRAKRHAALGVCPECMQEQEATRGFSTWDTAPSVRGYHWCVRHAKAVVHQCGVCGLAYNYLDFGWSPALRCKCGKSMDRTPQPTPSDFAKGIAHDIEQVLAGHLDGINGDEIRALLREGSERLHLYPGSPYDRTLAVLDESGAREFFEHHYGATNRYQMLKLAMLGSRFSGVPVVNLIACRLVYGSIDTLLATLLVKRAMSNTGQSTVPALPPEFTEGQRTAARLLIAETMVAHPDLPRRFLYEHAVAPITGAIATEVAWIQALGMQHRAGKVARRGRRLDADYARCIEARAIAYQKDVHAPRITTKSLTEGFFAHEAIGAHPACRAVVARYWETAGDCQRRRWRLLASEFPQCVDPHMAAALVRWQDVYIKTVTKHFRRLMQRVERFVGENRARS